MTPVELSIATMLALVSQLGPFRNVHCTPTQIQQMKEQLTKQPNDSVAGLTTLVKQTCKK